MGVETGKKVTGEETFHNLGQSAADGLFSFEFGVENLNTGVFEKFEGNDIFLLGLGIEAIPAFSNHLF
jgi:hypothetical protein